MASTFQGKSLALGGGGRFAKGVSNLEAKGEPAHEAQAVMAMAGRKKYGAKMMGQLAARGKK